MKQEIQIISNESRMTSLEIAELAGKQHKNVMQAIRNMEAAWAKATGLKFQLSTYKDSTGRFLPCFSLTKTECLYVATKFNDIARARLIIRWEELEKENLKMVSLKQQSTLLLETEEELMKRSDSIRRQKISKKNASADGCLTTSEIAKAEGVKVGDIYKELLDAGVIKRNGRNYILTKQYKDKNLARYRSFHYFGLDGEKKECNYIVWTMAGKEMIQGLTPTLP